MKKIRVILMFLSTIIILPFGAAQSVSVWDGTSEIWTQGSGTESNPYLIQNAQQLAYIAEMVNGGVAHYENTYFKLTTNVQIDSTTAWTPIGLDNNYYFSGHFDGDNHLVTLYLHTSTLQHVGLFGYTRGATFINLNVDGEVVSDAQSSVNIGGIAATVKDSVDIWNCHHQGNIRLTFMNAAPYSDITATAGGLIGNCEYNSDVTVGSCSNSGQILSNITLGALTGGIYTYLGGIAGRLDCTAAFINNSLNEGNVTSQMNIPNAVQMYSNNTNSVLYTGGLIGYSHVQKSIHVTDCHNSGTISHQASASYIKQNTHLGGLLGFLNMSGFIADYYMQSATCALYNLHNTGNVFGKNTFSLNNSSAYPAIRAGGIAGEITWQQSDFHGLISKCRNEGDVYAENEITSSASVEMTTTSFAGGILGASAPSSNGEYGAISIVNCCNYGDIAANNNTAYSNSSAGGICGSDFSHYDTIQMCYNIGDIQITNACSSNQNYSSAAIGGIVGYGESFIHTCYNKGEVFVNQYYSTDYPHCGGIVGEGNNVVYSCFNVGDLSVSNTTSYYLGGILGFGSGSSSANVKNSYNTGLLVGNGTQNKGGIVSGFNNTPVINSYYLNVCGHNMSGMGGLSKTSQEMQAESFPMTLNTDSLIFFQDFPPYSNNGYPIFGQISTLDATNVGNTSAKLNGYHNLPYNIDNHGFEYKQSDMMVYDTISIGTDSTMSYMLSGLQMGTEYTYRYFVRKGTSVYRGNEKTFTTTNCGLSVSISSDSEFLCEGDTISYTVSATSGTSSSSFKYLWNTGDTATSIRVTNGLTYTVTVTDLDANCSVFESIQTPMFPSMTNIIGTPQICPNQGSTLSVAEIGTYIWNTGENTSSIYVTQPGLYSVTVTNTNGCTASAAVTVSLLDSPTLAITGQTTICEGTSTMLTATGGISYLWNNGSTQNAIIATQGGTYSVTATNVEGCMASTEITVVANAIPEINIEGNSFFCFGESTTLTASGADTYLWSTGENTASVNINVFGVYTVTGTITSTGCSRVDTITVLVSQTPQITITGETDICAGESTTLTANGGTTYLWSNGSTDATLTVSTPGTWQVIGYNEAGCNAMASTTVSVWQPATSEFSVECSDSCYTWNAQFYCATGDYTQTLQTVYGCDSVVTLHLTITVGIDNFESAVIKAYPNPTDGIVTVDYDTQKPSQGYTVHVYDIYGKELKTIMSYDKSTKIDLSKYSDGIYFLKIVSEELVYGTKNVIKRSKR